jgi:holin-like protein
VLGMIVLFILLLTGVIKEHWLSSAINPLLQHLTFFFIPFAVELMQWGDFFIHKGIILFLPLVLSAFVGIAATGGIVQLLNKHSMDKK